MPSIFRKLVVLALPLGIALAAACGGLGPGAGEPSGPDAKQGGGGGPTGGGGACGDARCPTGANRVTYAEGRGGMDISGGGGMTVTGPQGQASFSTHGSGECRYQCIYPTCPTNTAPMIIDGSFTCYAPCAHMQCPAGTSPGVQTAAATITPASVKAEIDGGSDTRSVLSTSPDGGASVRVETSNCSMTCNLMMPCDTRTTRPVITKDRFECAPLPDCPAGQHRDANGGCAVNPAPPTQTHCEVKDCGVTNRTSCSITCDAPKQAKCSCDVCGKTIVETCKRENCRCE